MQLVRFDPFKYIQGVESDIDKLWENDLRAMPALTEVAAMDMYEEGDKLVAEVALPNFNKDEVNVRTDEGMLEVTAEHKEKEEEKGKRRYFFRESSNQYLRRVALPEGVKADKADATFKDGVLRVSMPMTAHKTLAQNITVK